MAFLEVEDSVTTVCIVVHAEGPGDLGSPARDVPPGESLLPEEQGSAHVLVQRILAKGANLPGGAIDFREPLRTQTGVRAYGSKLLDRRVLDEILTGWLFDNPLIVLLVDSDDNPPNERLSLLQEALEANYLKGAVGVAVKEFEAWLLADAAALSAVLGRSKSSPSSPEKLACREAKQLLSKWINEIATEKRNTADIRRELALAADLDVLSNTCPSFKVFQQELLQMNR